MDPSSSMNGRSARASTRLAAQRAAKKVRTISETTSTPVQAPPSPPDSLDIDNSEYLPKSSKTKKRTAIPRKTSYTPYHFSQQINKPEPVGQPEVWADKRQQLCETLPYYKSYQGSAYTSENVLHGVLVDSEVSPRDRFDEEIIITTVGGGREAGENGRMIRKKNQVETHFVAAFQNSMERQQPVAVIAGQGNKISPSKLPHVYNVLDWFHVTEVWAEKCNGFITWRVRLEKIFLNQRSWWAAQGSANSLKDSMADHPKPETLTCHRCGKTSKTLYNAGWACLQTGCSAFFTFENCCDDATLDFNDSFLKERTVFRGLVPGSLSVPLPTEHDMVKMGAYGFEAAFKRGIVCPECGCCSRRVYWDRWECENPLCDFRHSLKQKVLSAQDAIATGMAAADRGPLSNRTTAEFATAGISSTRSFPGQWVINEYTIPDENGEIIGFVRHFKSNGIINQQKDGPNDLFHQMQGQEFGHLKRSAARQAGGVGEILTSHFAANFGAKYKYGVAQVSKPFEDAPEPILKTVKRLTWAGQLALKAELDKGGSFQSFNECLVLGYFENSVIGYHDDGEETLGPTVSTLSLGAPARMQFRPKTGNKIGRLQENNIASLEGEKGKKDRKAKAPVLQFTLNHGDIVIMHGQLIQKLYEHSVTPWGPRFALTCRYIIADRMETEAERDKAVVDGTLPTKVNNYFYNGDLDATEIASSGDPASEIFPKIAAMYQNGDITQSQLMGLQDRIANLANPFTDS